MSDIHKADGLASKLWNLEIGSTTKTDSKRMVRFLDTNTINTIVALCDAAVKEASIALVCRIPECYVAVSTSRESYEPKRASSMRMLCEAHLGSGGEGDIPDYFDIDGKEITGQELIDAASIQAGGDL